MRYNDEIKNEVKRMYLEGMNSSEISKKMNIKVGTITYWLRNWGIARHRGPKSKIGNEHYFDFIDSERKAYFLGWLMADANISIYNNQYSLKIHISYRDKHIVDDFLSEIKSENKTLYKNNKLSSTGNNHESYYVSLTSVHMCKQLMNLGIIPNKTGKEIIPDIDKSLIPHFIRGFFDGDGITGIGRDKRCGFVSNYNMLKDLLRYINYNLNINICPHHTTPYIYYFLSGKDFSKHLYNYIYKDATIWLKRKRERMEIICDIK